MSCDTRVTEPSPSPSLPDRACCLKSYEPDEESVHNASTAGSAEEAGSQAPAATSTSSHGRSRASGNASGSGDVETPPPVPWDPPTGTWCVRFPSFQTKRTFLHRTSIRELRRVLAAQGKADGSDASSSKAALPVFLERRERLPEPTADDGKAGGKNAKKGGGKKPGKKGEPPEQPPQPIETPWRCLAAIDLSPLVQVDADGGGSACTGRARDTGGVEKPEAGGSPLRAELRALLALAPLPAGVVAPGANEEGARDGEENTPQASSRNSPATDGVGVRIGRWSLSKRCRKGEGDSLFVLSLVKVHGTTTS